MATSSSQTYAVLTGDLTDSSKIAPDKSNRLIQGLKGVLEKINRLWGGNQLSPNFAIFRGDSFQLILPGPQNALSAALLIRSTIRSLQPDGHEADWDARIAIGLGNIDHLPQNVSAGDGPAYRRSGPPLDALKKQHRLVITTKKAALNEECEPACALTDALINRWTAAQAEAISMRVDGLAPKEMANMLDISKTAVHYRLKAAGWFAIELFIERYRLLCQTHNFSFQPPTDD